MNFARKLSDQLVLHDFFFRRHIFVISDHHLNILTVILVVKLFIN